jgi:hypothetical protein
MQISMYALLAQYEESEMSVLRRVYTYMLWSLIIGVFLRHMFWTLFVHMFDVFDFPSHNETGASWQSQV